AAAAAAPLKKGCNLTVSIRNVSFKEKNPDLDLTDIQQNPHLPDDVKQALYGIADEEVPPKPGKSFKQSSYDPFDDEDEEEEEEEYLERRKKAGKKRKKVDSDYDDDWYSTTHAKSKGRKSGTPKKRDDTPPDTEKRERQLAAKRININKKRQEQRVEKERLLQQQRLEKERLQQQLLLRRQQQNRPTNGRSSNGMIDRQKAMPRTIPPDPLRIETSSNRGGAAAPVGRVCVLKAPSYQRRAASLDEVDPLSVRARQSLPSTKAPKPTPMIGKLVERKSLPDTFLSDVAKRYPELEIRPAKDYLLTSVGCKQEKQSTPSKAVAAKPRSATKPIQAATSLLLPIGKRPPQGRKSLPAVPTASSAPVPTTVSSSAAAAGSTPAPTNSTPKPKSTTKRRKSTPAVSAKPVVYETALKKPSPDLFDNSKDFFTVFNQFVAGDQMQVTTTHHPVMDKPVSSVATVPVPTKTGTLPVAGPLWNNKVRPLLVNSTSQIVRAASAALQMPTPPASSIPIQTLKSTEIAATCVNYVAQPRQVPVAPVNSIPPPSSSSTNGPVGGEMTENQRAAATQQAAADSTVILLHNGNQLNVTDRTILKVPKPPQPPPITIPVVASDGISPNNNGTSQPSSNLWSTIPESELIVKLCVFLPIIVFGLLGNGILLEVIFSNRTLRTPSHLLIANLVVTDFLTLLVCPLFFMTHDFFQNYLLGPIGCKLEGLIEGGLLVTSVLGMCVISYDRLSAVVLSSGTRLKGRGTVAAIVFCWLMGFSIAMPLSLYRHFKIRHWKDVDEMYCYEDRSVLATYWEFLLVMLVWVPLGVMLVAYTMIIVKLDRYERNALRRQHPMVVRYKSRVAKTLYIVLLAFIVVRVPFTIMVF
uniref:G-protein coupled receptors family 1 profile domain-containing protein n=1 Tax=Anopheles melas TaxID=34690 RepID=A0A182UJP1_9DIPT